MLSLLHKCPTFVTKDACKSRQQVHVLSKCLTVQMANLIIHFLNQYGRPKLMFIYSTLLTIVV